MSEVPEQTQRSQQAKMQAEKPMFVWQTTLTNLTDTVKLIMPSNQIIPIIFVPGIMGSNLQGKNGKPIWLLNKTFGQPVGLAWMWARKGPAGRQTVLHPSRTSVYPGGNVPNRSAGSISQRSEFIARGWGEVGETSYHEFLLWIEEKLNGQSFNPAEWRDFSYTSISATPTPGHPAAAPKLYPKITMKMQGLPTSVEGGQYTEAVLSDDLLKRAKCRFPVHACGYNWLQSNSLAATLLGKRIDKLIAQYNRNGFHCEQVILVTHSMGGLVARACTKIPGMSDKIVGVVHGVMPATGAAVAYRRCKIGMGDEDFAAGLVIGSNGREVTAVFAQAPGALQLLPSENYSAGWLRIKDEKGNIIEKLPKTDPYTEIYLRKDKWWGLIEEEWLQPVDGIAIEWKEFEKNILLAKQFHRHIATTYHANTFVYYGAGSGKQASFETIVWQIKKGVPPSAGLSPTIAQVLQKNHSEVRESGGNPIYVGGKTEYAASMTAMGGGTSYETAFWEIACGKQDGKGDGTVPASSGAAPRANAGGNVRQQFRLTGFSHEPAYKDPIAQTVTHYAITRLASLARIT
jgi:hypothetical protein